jgi:hypothetical protein
MVHGPRNLEQQREAAREGEYMVVVVGHDGLEMNLDYKEE